jgi:integrase
MRTRKRKGRLYARGKDNRLYADLRDLGGGREAMIPRGESFATKDWDVAAKLVAKRVLELEGQQRSKHLLGVDRRASIGEFASEWLKYKAGTDCRAKTLARYDLAFVHLFHVVDPATRMDLFAVKDAMKALADLRTVKSRKGGRLSGTSIKQVLVAMQQVYDHASTQGVVPNLYNPWRMIPKQDRPKTKRTTTDFLETHEAAELLKACDRIRTRYVPLRTLVSTFLLTGGRLSEVLGLEVGDIDFMRKTVRFRPNQWRPLKAGEERYVPLWPQLEQELKAHLSSRQRIGGLLFPGRSRTGTEKMLAGKVHKEIAAAAGRAHLGQHVTPQVFRVTYCAARLQSLDHGRPVALYTVQKELGHNSQAMINRVYGRLGMFPHRTEGVEYLERSSQQAVEDSPPEHAIG